MNTEELKAYIEDLLTLLADAQEQLAAQANPTDYPMAEQSVGGWTGPDPRGGFAYEPLAEIKLRWAQGNRVEKLAVAQDKVFNTQFVCRPFELTESLEKWVADNYNEAARNRIFMSPKYGFRFHNAYSTFHSDPGRHNVLARTRPDANSYLEGYSVIYSGNQGLVHSVEVFEDYVANHLEADRYYRAAHRLGSLDRLYANMRSKTAREYFISSHPGYEPGERISAAAADNPYL